MFLTLFLSFQLFAYDTVDYVNLDSYLGKWYEIARQPNSFQDDDLESPCFNTTATYSESIFGNIKVLNECEFLNSKGEIEVESGKAKAVVVDKESNAKLKVNFIPFWQHIPGLRIFGAGDYWIAALGEENADGLYNWAIVISPNKDETALSAAWILSRDRNFTKDPEFTYALGILEELGVDLSELVYSQKGL